MWVSSDSYNAQKAEDFEAEPDPLQPARDALQFARDTAGPWAPAQWAADAQEFARTTSPGMGDVQRYGRVEREAPDPMGGSMEQAARPDNVGFGQGIAGLAGGAWRTLGDVGTYTGAITGAVAAGISERLGNQDVRHVPTEEEITQQRIRANAGLPLNPRAAPIAGAIARGITAGAPEAGEIDPFDFARTVRAGEEYAEKNPSGEFAAELAFPLQYGTTYKALAKAGALPADALMGIAKGSRAAKTVEAPTYYRGTAPGRTERIQTGVGNWDRRLFVTDSPEGARLYGSNIEEMQLRPESRVLTEGTPEFNRIVGRAKKGQSMLDWSNDGINKAEAAGYDAVHFARQTDVGTVILNEDAIAVRRPHVEPTAGLPALRGETSLDAPPVAAIGAGGVPPVGPPRLPPGAGDVPPGGANPNRGREANDILNKMYTPEKKGPSLPDFSKMKDAIVLRWFNQNMPLEKIQELAEQAKRVTGDELEANEMAATLNRMNASGTAERRLQSGLSPVLQDVADRGDTGLLSNYLTFRQNMDAAAALDNPNRAFSGGLSAEDSRQGILHLARTLGPERFAQLEMDAGKVADFTRSMLDRKLEAGLIDRATRDLLARRYQYYTPTKILDYLRDPDRVATGSKINVNDPKVNSYTFGGTEKARQDPLHSVVNYAYETEALAAKNEVFNAFMRQRDIIPGATEIFPEMPRGYTPTKNEITISGFVDGEKKTLLVPEDLRSAFERTTHEPIPVLSQMMTVYKAMITSRNPVFLASNALNDFGSYAVRASSREGGPQALPRVVGALFDAYRDAFKGVGTGRYGPKTETFLEGGGAQFGFFQRSEENARKTVNELARRNTLVVRDKSDVMRLVKDVLTLKPVEALGSRIELAPRVAAAELARNAGAKGPKVVEAGRTVTMDFAVGGDLSKMLNQFIPFFNVGMQAPAQVVRAYRENPKGFVGTAAAVLAAPTVAAEAWNRSDPGRAKDYEDVPDYVKASNIVIMLPGASYTDKQGNVHPQFIAVPTREYSPFVTMTRETAGRALGADPRSWQELLSDSMQSVSPIQGGSPGEMAAQVGIPGATTAAQLYYNKDPFTGAMIATERKDESASPLSMGISAGMGQIADVTGVGSTPRPSQVEWAVQDLTGGVGRAAIGASKLAGGDQSNAGPGAIPLVGGVVGKLVRGQTGQRLEEAQQNVMAPQVKKALAEYDITTNFGPVSRSANGVDLTMAEQERYQVLANERVDTYVRELLASPEWAQFTPEVRKRVIGRVVQDARESAKRAMLPEMMSNDQYRERLRQSKAAK